VLIFAVGVGGFVALIKFKPQPESRPQEIRLPLVRAEPVVWRTGPLAVTGHGLVRPVTEVTLGAEVSGKVAQVSPGLVSGGRFARGELLVRLDPAPFQATLAQAEADRQAARAALALAEASLKRTEELIAQGFLSRQALDERIANRDQARAALARADALADQRRIDLERTRVTAPFAGRVLSRRIDVGDTVQPGKELARIFADNELEVAVALTDHEMALVANPWGRGGKDAARARATVSVAHGARRYRWPARVDRVEAAVDSATRSFNVVVRIAAPNQPGTPADEQPGSGPPLVVGMYATVAIEGRDPGRHAIVPRTALRDDARIWVLDAGDTIRIVPVRVLSETDESVTLAADGIAPDARIVVSDLRIVTAGMAVRVIEDARAASAAPASSTAAPAAGSAAPGTPVGAKP